MKRSILAVLGAIALAAHPLAAQTWHPKEAQQAEVAAARIRNAMRDEVNSGLVGVVYGDMDATDLGKANDLATSFETEDGRSRPLLVVGKGAFRNVTDIYFTRGVDMGIVQSDALAKLKREPPFPGIESYIEYITKLYDEEVHTSPPRIPLRSTSWHPRK
jgi:uncharacterized protein